MKVLKIFFPNNNCHKTRMRKYHESALVCPFETLAVLNPLYGVLCINLGEFIFVSFCDYDEGQKSDVIKSGQCHRRLSFYPL